MATVGRRRTKDHDCPQGVRLIGGRWYWQPPTLRERKERKAAGLPSSVPLGKPGVEARKKWATLSGYRDAPVVAGEVGELIDLFDQELELDLLRPEPERKRRGSTIVQYRRQLKFLRKRFGTCKYGKTEAEAAHGKALALVDVQRFLVDAEKKKMANRHVAVLSAIFTHAMRRGRTTYNPCAGVEDNPERPREREALPWEVECLRVMAKPLLSLLIRYERICGWRPSDMLDLQPKALTPEGVKLRAAKRGKRQLWQWTPELRAIIEEAAKLPGTKVVSIDPEKRFIFPNRRGKRLSISVFDEMFRTTLAKVNKLLDEDGLGVRIEGLQFRDLRPAAGKDAVARGESRSRFLGNSPATADKHYSREEQVLLPNE